MQFRKLVFYDYEVELASNLVWLATAIAVLSGTMWTLRRGRTTLTPMAAITLACVICLLLLPVISITDDLMEAHQAALPASSQTWRMASEDASVGLELVPVFCSFLLMLAMFLASTPIRREDDGHLVPIASWLMRSLRLRPPPFSTI